jgi:hypothetical protein
VSAVINGIPASLAVSETLALYDALAHGALLCADSGAGAAAVGAPSEDTSGEGQGGKNECELDLECGVGLGCGVVAGW